MTNANGNAVQNPENRAKRIPSKNAMILLFIFLVSMVFLLGCTSKKEITSSDPSKTPGPATAQSTSTETEKPTEEADIELTATGTVEPDPLPEITLCEDEWEGDYCIFSIGYSADKQVISLKHTESAQVEIFLLVNEESYYCRTVDDYPGYLYCFGPLLSNFSGAKVEIVTVAEDEALARGIVDLPYLDQVPTKPADGPGYY